MATVGAYSRHAMFAEMNSPLYTNAGDGVTPLVYSPAEQKARARVNIGHAVSPGGGIRGFAVAPATATGTATLTTNQVLTGFIVATPAGAATYTLPTGTQLDAAVTAPALEVGEFVEFIIQNTTANLITVAVGAGITSQAGANGLFVAATAATGTQTAVRFRLRKTAANTFDLFRSA